MRRLKFMVHRHRAPSTNLSLGLLLAFNAGAINAGGFLVLRMYTSHMTGFTSQFADALVLGSRTLLLNALGAVLAFTIGAATCALMVHWARHRHLHAVYALPLALEAALLLPFGCIGAITLQWQTPFAIPLTVLLLSFIMGLQNAVASKTSGGSIRTTHMTGNITDLGMELGKGLYWARGEKPADGVRRIHRQRLARAAGLVAAFVAGGITGALGFQNWGFVFVLPLAGLLLALSMPPIVHDWRARGRAQARANTGA